MSTPGDNGSWNSQGNDFNAQDGGRNGWSQPPQDPWAQPPAEQDPYAQPPAGSASDPYGQQAAGQDPYAQPPAGSASDPYGQGQQSWSAAPGSGPSASDPFSAPAGQPHLGQPPLGQAPQGQAQSRLTVGLLGIFLGAFGVHRFMLGYTTIGIIQIVVTVLTCGVGGWWGVIEGILVLTKSPSFERDAYGRPLTD